MWARSSYLTRSDSADTVEGNSNNKYFEDGVGRHSTANSRTACAITCQSNFQYMKGTEFREFFNSFGVKRMSV